MILAKRDHLLGIAAVVAAALLLLLTSFHVPVASGRNAPVEAVPGPMAELSAAQTTMSLRPIHAPGAAADELFTSGSGPSAAMATADIQVAYNGFSAQAQAAFEAAVTVWESQIVSSRVIHINANWTPLGANVLGSAGTTWYVPLSGRYHAAALAEAMCACERTDSEINANFNSNFSGWYLGTDGNAPSNKWDFYTVVLHEIGHGLGFFSSFRVNGSDGSWGIGGVSTLYDEHEWNAASGGNKLTDTTSYGNPSAALRMELTDGSVYFGGPNVVAELGGRARLYAPNPWSGGSSNSHFDESTFTTGTQHALMTPSLANGEVIHDPGPLTRALFRDIGWTTTDSPTDTEPPTVGPPTATIVVPQQLAPTSAVRLTWPGAADESGIDWYELQRRQGSGSWVVVALSTPTSTTADVALARGTPYTFRLRAADGAGNVGPWTTAAPQTLALLQESAPSVGYTGAWKIGSVSGSSGGRVRYAGGIGRVATLTFNGTSAALVTTRSPARGIAEIWLDGAFVQAADLYSASAVKKAVVWAPAAPLAAGVHTLEVRVTGTRNAAATKSRIDVDAFLVWP